MSDERTVIADSGAATGRRRTAVGLAAILMFLIGACGGSSDDLLEADVVDADDRTDTAEVESETESDSGPAASWCFDIGAAELDPVLGSGWFDDSGTGARSGSCSQFWRTDDRDAPARSVAMSAVPETELSPDEQVDFRVSAVEALVESIEVGDFAGETAVFEFNETLSETHLYLPDAELSLKVFGWEGGATRGELESIRDDLLTVMLDQHRSR